MREVYAAPLAALVISLIALGLAYGVPAWDTLSTFMRLTFTAFIGSGIYLIALFLLRPDEMRERVRYVRQLLSPRGTT
jgi:hypothetical protein